MKEDLLRISWSDSVEASLLSVPESTRVKLGEAWSTPKISIEKTPQKFKELISELDNKGLLSTPCIDSEAKVRKLSYLELVYIDTLIALNLFNVKSDKIQAKLFSFFGQKYDEDKAQFIYTLEWLDAFISVFSGVDIEFIVEDQDINAFDPVYGSMFATKPTVGQLRVSLSAITNRVNERLGIKPISIKRNFGDLPLEKSELDIVLNTRNLESSSEESIHISKTKADKILVELSKVEEIDPKITIDEASKKHRDILSNNNYSTIETVQRDGQIVKIKKKTQTLYE